MADSFDATAIFDGSIDQESYLAESGLKLHELVEILRKHNSNFRDIVDGQAKICKASRISFRNLIGNLIIERLYFEIIFPH